MTLLQTHSQEINTSSASPILSFSLFSSSSLLTFSSRCIVCLTSGPIDFLLQKKTTPVTRSGSPLGFRAVHFSLSVCSLLLLTCFSPNMIILSSEGWRSCSERSVSVVSPPRQKDVCAETFGSFPTTL